MIWIFSVVHESNRISNNQYVSPKASFWVTMLPHGNSGKSHAEDFFLWKSFECSVQAMARNENDLTQNKMETLPTWDTKMTQNGCFFSGSAWAGPSHGLQHILKACCDCCQSEWWMLFAAISASRKMEQIAPLMPEKSFCNGKPRTPHQCKQKSLTLQWPSMVPLDNAIFIENFSKPWNETKSTKDQSLLIGLTVCKGFWMENLLFIDLDCQWQDSLSQTQIVCSTQLWKVTLRRTVNNDGNNKHSEKKQCKTRSESTDKEHSVTANGCWLVGNKRIVPSMTWKWFDLTRMSKRLEPQNANGRPRGNDVQNGRTTHTFMKSSQRGGISLSRQPLSVLYVLVRYGLLRTFIIMMWSICFHWEKWVTSIPSSWITGNYVVWFDLLLHTWLLTH